MSLTRDRRQGGDTPESRPLLPGAWLGMLGGGQLGRMFCHAAQRLGYRVVVLDPDPDSPAGAIAERHVCSAYDDESVLLEFAGLCHAVTTEFENIPAATLAFLARHRPVHPGADAVAIVQDRIREKDFIRRAGVPVAPYAPIPDAAALAAVPEDLFPGILKAARFGYDGKGQARVTTRDDALAAFREFGEVPCVLEALMPLEIEVSIVLARDADGATALYPPIQNEHRDGILAVSSSDALAVQPDRAEQAGRAAVAIAKALDYVGVLCVEFFLVQGGGLVVNEIAPRPHNSGHYTVDASVVSQFEQQVRTLAGMPLGPCDTVRPAIMLNVLGDLWFRDGNDTPVDPPWADVLAVPGAHLHLYGKASVRRGRKMGHVTVVGATAAGARESAAQVARILGLPFA